MPENYGQHVLKRVSQFYSGAFATIGIFSLLLAFKTNMLFLIMSFFSTALVVFYSFVYRANPQFKTYG